MKTVFLLGSLAFFLAVGALAAAYTPECPAFEPLTGINWDSFQAAKADCEAHFKEPCKLHGGFAPLSSLKD